MKIGKVTGRPILDSRGVPTVEARVQVGSSVGVAAVPAGISTGSHEALELRDGDARWEGNGVTKAVSHVNVEIASALKGKELKDQAALDHELNALDGTENKSRLGANAVLAVSLAALQAEALEAKQPLWKQLAAYHGTEATPLPVPLCNMLEGATHADNNLSIQECMIVPVGFTKFSEAVRAAAEIFYALGKLLKGRGASKNVGAEGGYAPNLPNHQAALDLLIEAIKQAGYKPGDEIALALDMAASELYRDGSYIFEGQGLTAEQMTTLYASLLENYPIVSLEDPLAEDDWDGWRHLAGRIGGKVQIVGDDLTVTNSGRISQALEAEVMSAAILKPNQIGTYSEARQAFELLTKAGAAGIVSHRSGETSDTTIADMVVGWGTGQIKCGSLSRGERVAKYNRLLEIEQELGSGAVYAGPAVQKLWKKNHART
jgi:enolase